MPGQKAAETERREQILAAAYAIAARDGLDRLTIRAVAAAAGLSHGLVHFHFRSKADLLAALLDWMLMQTPPTFELGSTVPDVVPAPERLLALLRQEVGRLARDRRRIHLFFDFWLIGTRHAHIRSRMRAELARRREAFRPMIEEVLRSDPDRFSGVSADSLAAVLVALVKGAAVQAVLDPRGFDADGFTRAVHALLPLLLESAA